MDFLRAERDVNIMDMNLLYKQSILPKEVDFWEESYADYKRRLRLE
jgi:hypothetical protein